MLTEFVLGAVQVVVEFTATVIVIVMLTAYTYTSLALNYIRNHGAITPARINAPMKNGIAR